MKVYVAALYSTLKETRRIAQLLEEAGHECTARWLNGGEEGQSKQAAALMDLEDVRRADVLLLLTLPFGTLFKGGGRCVEFGYALGLGKQVAVVGDYENIFMHLPQVSVYSTVGAFIDFLDVGAENVRNPG